MPRIEDILSPKNLVDYTKEAPQPAMALREIFPESKQTELEVEMIKGANEKPVTAHIHAFDTEAEVASREGYKGDIAQLALVKRKFRLSEKDIIAIETPRSDEEARMAIRRVYNDIDRLTNAINTRFEAMRGEVLCTGKQVINENGYKTTLDYGVPNAHKQSYTWSTGTPKILDDIYNACDLIVRDTGFTPTRILTSRKVLNIILKDTTVRSAVLGTEKDRVLVLNNLNQTLTSMGLPTIATYDAQYRKQNKNGSYTTARYFDEDTIVFMPAGKMGDTFFGPTAEEIRARQDPASQVQSYGNIIVQHYFTQDPVGEWIKGAATGMVTFPYADQVIIGTVS